MQEKEPRSYLELIDKLDRFTRKYYLNQVIRGSLLFVGLVLFLFLLFSALEFNFYFTTAVRKVLFFTFIGAGALSLYQWILKPLFSLLRLGSTISHEQAAAIIGTHFQDVKDQLINVLQLKSQLNEQKDNTLLLASIDQKTARIKPVPFRNAIDLYKNKKYLKYALPPLLLLAIALMTWPAMISEGSGRIIKNNQYFEKPAPFHFHVMEADNLKAVQYSDFIVHVDTKGEYVPERAFIEYDGQTYQLAKSDEHDFSFSIKNIRSDLTFRLTSGEVASQPFEIEVLKKPQFLDMKIKAVYPTYIGRASEVFDNNGDLSVPVGTQLTWMVNAKETNRIQGQFNPGDRSDLIPFDEPKSGAFEYKKGVYSDIPYVLYASNDDLPLADSMHYYIESIPDQPPSISVQSVDDSLNHEMRFFTGKADDDYGLSKLYVVARVRDARGNDGEEIKKVIQSVNGLFTSFDYLFSVDSFQLDDGEELFYHFEVWDNDAVRGSKVAKTSVYHYRKASLEELSEKTKENSEEIKDSLKKNLKKTQDLKKEIKELREKFLNKKELNWQDKKDAEKLRDKQEEIRKSLEKAKNQLQENMDNQEKLADVPEELKQKQENLKEMMDKVVNDELKELMDEINKLLEELQREESIDKMEEMEMSSQEMELEMDKMLELYKQLEVEVELQREIEKLNELAEKQEELSEETNEGEKSDEELKEEQEKLSEEFKKIRDELEALKEKNKELENPKNIEDTKEVEEEITKEQEKSEEALSKEDQKSDEKTSESEEKQDGEEGESSEESSDEQQDQQEQSPSNENQKAAQSQKKAGQKMKQMAEQLQSGMQGGQMDQMGEDIKMVRQLLENILTLSFEEENLIDNFNQTSEKTLRYVELVQDQFKIEDDFSLVRDSLHALSKRNEKIQSFVMDKVADIEKNLSKSIKQLEERQKGQAGASQRYVMTYLNDLAVMLSESMQQMQEQMSSMMPGSQMCNNPKPGQGNGQKPLDKITQGQKQIKDGMEKMMQKKEGGEQPGSEDFGKMAQQQAAIRKMLRDMQQGKSERGQNDQLLQEIIDAMDGIEKDLVNKQLTNEMLKRQQEIETRLLEAEKAERQRDMDEKREARTAEKIERSLPPAIEAYLKERENQVREINKTSPLLTPYYKQLVDSYYKSLNK